MTTVADIMEASPGLRERAIDAHHEAQRAKIEREENEYQILIEEMLAFFTQDLGVAKHDLEDVEFQRMPRENDFPVAACKVGGILFRGSYSREKVKVSHDHTYEESNLRMQMSNGGKLGVNTGWLLIKDLVDLGRCLA